MYPQDKNSVRLLDALRYAVPAQLLDALRYAVPAQLLDSLRYAVPAQLLDALWYAVPAQLLDALWYAVPAQLLDALWYAVPVRLQNGIISPSRDAFNDSGTIPKGTGQLYSGSKGCRSVSLINHSHLVPRFRLLLCSCSVHGCSPVDIRAFARLMLGQWWIAVSSCGNAALWRWDILFLLCRDNEIGTSCVGRAAATATATATDG